MRTRALRTATNCPRWNLYKPQFAEQHPILRKVFIPHEKIVCGIVFFRVPWRDATASWRDARSAA